jgi:uncharacterized membrane protein YsdA (DUF1294 family)
MNRRGLPPFAIFAIVATAIAGLGVGLALLGSLPWWIAYLAGINLATLALYGYDKGAAVKERLRVPELLLHLLAVLGGTPASFLAQALFRHKTAKRSFQVAFWIIAVAQIVLIGTAWEWRANPPAWLPAGAQSILKGR